jgi:hypothetical protein
MHHSKEIFLFGYIEISKCLFTTYRGQFCRAYHSIEYKHICIPSPKNNDAQIKTLNALFCVRCGNISIEITILSAKLLIRIKILDKLTSKNSKLNEKYWIKITKC